MKKNKIMRVLSSLALTATLCLGSVFPTLAAPIYGTETNPAKASIAKVLQVAEGTTTPTVTFTFKITPKSVNGTAATATNMPSISDQTVGYNAADTAPVAAGLIQMPKETADIFAGIIWPHAGEYTYTITEQNDGATGYTYSQGRYDITAYVANSSAGGLYIAAIGTTIKVKDNNGQTVGDKVDPTQGGSPSITGDYSGLVFTNTYEKTTGNVDPVTGTQAMNISKTVTGDYGDRTKMFDYSLTLTKAATSSTNPTYKVYVVDTATNTVVTSTANYSGTILNDPTYGNYFNLTAGRAENYSLKHGQKLVIPEAIVGTTYTVTEAAASDYTPSVSVVENGGAAVVTAGTIGTALSIANKLIGENANSAAYTNTYKTVTPTGIAMDNLPFVIALALAAVTLVAFVVVKARRRGYIG